MRRPKPYLARYGTLNGFAIWLVDAKFVRDSIDVGFTNADQPLHKRYIPKGEIWIDAATDRGEIRLIAKSQVREARLMANGKSYVTADRIAIKAERKSRKTDSAIHARVKRERWGSNGKLSVFLVK